LRGVVDVCVYDCVEGIRRREEGEREVQRHVRQSVCVGEKGKRFLDRLTNRQTIRQTRQMQSKIKKRAHTETTIFT
jgi:hypothetical protein